MRLKIVNPQDFWCGLFFIALGAAAMVAARAYPMGSALQMGPGYFPTWLGGILIGIGAAVGGFSLKRAPEPEDEAALREWAFRPWLVLTAAIAVYAVLMDAGFGFVPSLMVLVIGCAAAHKDVRWVETLVLSVCVTAASVAIFYFGLRLPYQLFWWSA
jgi:uncharacterized membrane protein YfcA